jgi:uncharacterized delta-60 repeat protein
MSIYKPKHLLVGTSFLLGSLAPALEYRVDSTYATSGIFRQEGGAVRGVVVQSNGKILLASTMPPLNGGATAFGLIRQNSNGTLDTTYDTDGISLTDFGANTFSVVGGMAESPVDGKIYIVGYRGKSNYNFNPARYESDIAIACFNADGSINTDFNFTGKATFSFNPITNPSQTGYRLSGANCLAVQADGKIVVGGWAEVGSSDYRFAMVRYLTTGAIDSSFGVGGYVLTNPGTYCSINALAISPVDQMIVAVGEYQEPQSPYGYKNMVARYDTNGTLDTNFDTDGYVLTGGGTQNNRPASVAIQSDNKIVVGGSSYIKDPFSEPDDFALFRYLSTGELDTTFDTDGMAIIDHIGGYDSIRQIKLQSGGKILAAGTAGGDPADSASVGSFAMLMFNSNGSLDTTFDNDGKVITTGPTTRVAYCVAQQSNGKIIVAGEFYGANSAPGEAAAVRYELVPVVVIIPTRKTDLLIGLKSTATLGANIYNNTGVGQTQALGLGFKATKPAYIGVQNDGTAPDSFKVKSTPGNSDFTVNYFKGTTNITAAIVAGTYQTATLAPNATEILKVVVKAKSKRSAEKRTLAVTASSVAKSIESDKALIKVTSKAKPK